MGCAFSDLMCVFMAPPVLCSLPAATIFTQFVSFYKLSVPRYFWLTNNPPRPLTPSFSTTVTSPSSPPINTIYIPGQCAGTNNEKQLEHLVLFSLILARKYYTFASAADVTDGTDHQWWQRPLMKQPTGTVTASVNNYALTDSPRPPTRWPRPPTT